MSVPRHGRLVGQDKRTKGWPAVRVARPNMLIKMGADCLLLRVLGAVELAIQFPGTVDQSNPHPAENNHQRNSWPLSGKNTEGLQSLKAGSPLPGPDALPTGLELEAW